MIRSDRQIRAFTLLELLSTIAVAMVIIAVLGKLLLDGIYLQRIAWEQANRVAITGALTDRLRADALGAATHTWDQHASGCTLKLLTCADGSLQPVQWTFEQNHVLRRVDGREAGNFHAERLEFSAHVEQAPRGDLLVLDLIVTPPARARHRPSRTCSECVLLPQPTGVTASAEWEQRP